MFLVGHSLCCSSCRNSPPYTSWLNTTCWGPLWYWVMQMHLRLGRNRLKSARKPFTSKWCMHLNVTFGMFFFSSYIKIFRSKSTSRLVSKCSADRQQSKYNTWIWFIRRSLQSQIRPATHFNTLPSPHMSYGAFLAAFIHFTNGHIPIILHHLWEAHYPNDLAENLLTVGIYPFLCSLLHPVLSYND